MIKTDYIAITLFVIGVCVSALLWGLFIHPSSVLILFVSAVLGVWYFAYRTRWWKKKSEKESEGGA
jgi:hypothetical protein